MEKKLANHSCHAGIYVVPADAMIRGATSTSLCSRVLSWSLRMIAASLRVVLLTSFAVGFALAMSFMYLADVRSARRMQAQRRAVSFVARRSPASVRRPTLQLSSY
jgi:hypothetical protein